MDGFKDVSPADLINAAATVVSAFVGWAAYRLNRRIDGKNHPAMEAWATAYNVKWKDNGLVSTLDLNIVNKVEFRSLLPR